MPNEDEVRAELVGLLRYANLSAIARELGVSAQSVKNWAQGKHPSEDRLNAIKRLYGLPVTQRGTTKEALRPDWAEGLEARIAGEVLTRLGESPLVDQLEDRLEALGLLPVAGSGEESPAPRDDGRTAQRP